VVTGSARTAVGGRETTDLIRAVYLEKIRGEAANATNLRKKLGVSQLQLRVAVGEARKRGLVKLKGSSVELTSAGKGRLKVVMLGGAFEIIHPGHIAAVSEARSMGNTLVVVVATDENVEKNKGRPPVTSQAQRVKLVSSLRQVDLALAGNKGSIFDILLRVRPDVVALGYDQRLNLDDIVKEAAKRGLKLTAARLGTTIPEVKTSKILFST
jgi:cytidyltransferase-like protein